MLSNIEKEHIVNSWKSIMKDPVSFSRTFYDKLFDIDPNMKKLFKDNIEIQQIKLIDSLKYLVKRMWDLQEATIKMKKLGLKHKSYAVKKHHYPKFGEAFVYTLEYYLGDEFSEICRISWSKLYDSVSEIMILGSQRK
ncbi:MAG: globin domain-containing protein [Candidatus Kariarchaeaceae archaeon]